MTTDLTGGLDPAREYVFPEVPETAGMRDAVNMWVWDDEGRLGLPRFAVEAVAPEWEAHELHLSLAFPDGRLLRNWAKGPAHPVIGHEGLASIFGAGPLRFECVEPFRRYRASYDGDATDSSFAELSVPGASPQDRAALRFEIEAECVVPPWVQGTMSADAAAMLASDVEGDFMGGDRLEQLCRVHGWVSVDGIRQDFTGGGLRIRRQGVRQVSGFWGHCWQSAVFPSGKAFGYIAYPPRSDGQPSYNEGYVFSGDGTISPARAIVSPWLTGYQFSGEDVSLVLKTEQGHVRIAAETAMGMPTISSAELTFPPLFQSIVRYTWDGEEAYGMMERSNLPDRVRIPG